MLPDILRRIVNAKYVLQRAAKMQDENSEISLSISLLLMHDAIEMLMIAVLDHLQIGVKPKREFMDFWSEIKQAGHPSAPDLLPMQSLNKLRVGLKHNGNSPNPKQVRELLPRTRGFFENVLSTYCHISYGDVSLVDLVPDQEVRDLLKGSREKFVSGEKVDSLIDLKIALHKIEHPSARVLPRLQAPNKPSLPSELNRAVGPYLDQLHTFLAQIAAKTNAIALGVDPIRYAHFVRSTPTLLWSMAGTHQAQLWGTYDQLTLDDYEELSLFLIEYALRAEESYVRTEPN
jgi:hypothetical protein